MKRRTKALIIARGGSVRVKHKNVRNFADTGKSILRLKIEQLQRISGLESVVVNSEDEIILMLAHSCGAETVKRRKYYASSFVDIHEVYANVAEEMDCDDILFCNCTSPMISDESIERVLKTPYFSPIFGDCKSINTINLVHKFLWEDSNNSIEPLYNPEKQPKSQNIRNLFEINFACSKVDRDYMALSGRLVGKNWIPFTIPEEEATDIDTETDWKLAELLWKEKSL